MNSVCLGRKKNTESKRCDWDTKLSHVLASPFSGWWRGLLTLNLTTWAGSGQTFQLALCNLGIFQALVCPFLFLSQRICERFKKLSGKFVHIFVSLSPMYNFSMLEIHEVLCSDSFAARSFAEQICITTFNCVLIWVLYEYSWSTVIWADLS